MAFKIALNKFEKPIKFWIIKRKNIRSKILFYFSLISNLVFEKLKVVLTFKPNYNNNKTWIIIVMITIMTIALQCETNLSRAEIKIIESHKRDFEMVDIWSECTQNIKLNNKWKRYIITFSVLSFENELIISL
jgi:hypothetical protein